MEIERLQNSVDRLRARLGAAEDAEIDGKAPDTKMKNIISRYLINTINFINVFYNNLLVLLTQKKKKNCIFTFI